MRRSMVTLSLLALIPACAPKPPNLIWEKPKATLQNLSSDKYKCLQDAASKAPTVAGSFGAYSANDYGASGYLTSGNMNAGLQHQMFNSCMESKGWHILNATQMAKELKEAETACHSADIRDQEKAIEPNECLARLERPIWKKDEPNTLDLYDKFRAKNIELATQYHDGGITKENYISALKEADITFKTNLSARRSLEDN